MPPTPIQVASRPDSVFGWTLWFVSGARVVPCHVTGCSLEHRGEQVELLVEQLLVLLEVEAEQREGLDEGPAPEDHLGAPVRHRIERREPLEHADRIVRRQHRHGGAEPDAPRAARDRRQHHVRSRDREVGAVMLADADGIDADLVGEDRLLDQVADHLRGMQRFAVRARGDVAEGVEAELDCAAHQRMIPKKPAPDTGCGGDPTRSCA